jgi:hypothetical protein
MVLRACGRNYWKIQNTEGNNQMKLSNKLMNSDEEWQKDLIEIKVRRDNNDNDDPC